MSKQVFIKLIPVLGSIILFLCWAFQQTLLNEINSTSQRISNAQGVFQTYQSNNALFNALLETINNGRGSVDKIRRLQISNYELGLRELETLLDAETKATIPSPPNAFSSTLDAATMLNVTQERINTIQGKLALKREEIAKHKTVLNTMFLLLYAIGSITVLTGSVLGAIQSARPSESQTSATKT